MGLRMPSWGIPMFLELSRGEFILTYSATGQQHEMIRFQGLRDKRGCQTKLQLGKKARVKKNQCGTMIVCLDTVAVDLYFVPVQIGF